MDERNRKRNVAIVAIAVVVIIVVILAIYPRDVRVTWEGEGEVSPTEGTVNALGGMTLEIVPEDGWYVASVTVDGSEIDLEGDTLEVGRSIIDLSAVTVHVVFEEGSPGSDGHTITVTHTSGGTITPSGEVTVEDGGSVTFTVSAYAGYRLSSLRLDGGVVTVTDGTYTLSNVTEDHTLHATFVRSGSGGSTVRLTEITIEQGPDRTVYSVGEEFDPTGMVVVAHYSDGSSRELDQSEYAWSPSGALAISDDTITVSYGGMTADVGIIVVSPDDFEVVVTGYEGTRVVNGAVESFSESPDVNLSDFGFDTASIVPGIKQTATMTVTNGTSVDLDAVVYISGITGADTALAEQITLTVNCNGNTETVTLSELAAGTLLDIGTIAAGGSAEVTVTMEFPESEDNNDAMGQSVSFSLGVFADDLTG